MQRETFNDKGEEKLGGSGAHGGKAEDRKHIFAKVAAKRSVIVRVTPSDSIKELKKELTDKLVHGGPDVMMLVSGGKHFRDEFSLSDYGLATTRRYS